MRNSLCYAFTKHVLSVISSAIHETIPSSALTLSLFHDRQFLSAVDSHV